MITSLHEIVRACGGVVAGGQALIPGPGHSPRDRSLSVMLSTTAPYGFLAFSYAGDPWEACRDHVTVKLGLDPDAWKTRSHHQEPKPRQRTAPNDDNLGRARWLWNRRCPLEGTIGEAYLRRARGYPGLPIPPTIGFLPSDGKHPPSLICAMGIPTKPEPGKLEISDSAVMGVHLIKLTPDGTGKVGGDKAKITLSRVAMGSPIVVSPMNDLLGLAVCEGVEDALSLFAGNGFGVWAAGGASRMPALAETVPDYADVVSVVAGDNEAGRKYAGALATALVERLGVKRVKLKIWGRS